LHWERNAIRRELEEQMGSESTISIVSSASDTLGIYARDKEPSWFEVLLWVDHDHLQTHNICFLFLLCWGGQNEFFFETTFFSRLEQKTPCSHFSLLWARAFIPTTDPTHSHPTDVPLSQPLHQQRPLKSKE